MLPVHGLDVSLMLFVVNSFTMMLFFCVFDMLSSVAVWWWNGSSCSSHRILVI